MSKFPDVLGYRLSAGIEILKPAGFRYRTEVAEPLKPRSLKEAEEDTRVTDVTGADPDVRIIRQREDSDGTLVLTVCRVSEDENAGHGKGKR
ncbi:MAG: hypothetical protein K5767_05900 [Clostridia bacterium]|nr:hypothetical protein [Clostridia bacterium]